MAEKVGLIAILDMSQFNRSFAAYTRSLNQMNSQANKISSDSSNSFTRIGSSIGTLAGLADKATGGMGSAFLSLGDSVNVLVDKIAIGLVGALVAATAAVGAFVASGISQAANLEAQLDGINAILGITETQGQAVKDAILQLGLDPQLKVTASEAAQAVELLARNGLSTTEIIGEMGDMSDSAAKAVVLLANAVGADFGLAADIATDAMLIFNKDTGDMIDIVSGITGVVNNSKFTIQDYNLALRNGGAAADIMGVSIEEFNTVIAASAEELGRGMKAGTGFSAFLDRLTPSTNSATDAMRELGFITADGSNIFFTANGELKDMSEITRILNEVLFGAKTVMGEVGGRTAEQNRILGELTEQYSDAEMKIADYEAGIRGLTLTEEERNDKINEQREIMALLAPRIEELNSIRGELVTTTSKLTDEERSVALEAIFQRDAMKTVIALAKEGKPAFTDVATAMEELGVSQAEATRIVEEGITAYEILYEKIGNVDAIQQAEQRMGNLKGSLEILKGIIETVQIKIGDAFIPVLTLMADKLRVVANDIGPQVIQFFEKVGGFIDALVTGIMAGNDPLSAFLGSLRDIGLDDFADKLQTSITALENFIKPISEFVREHSEAFIGALQGIGGLLASAAIAARIIAIGSAIVSLVNPVTALIALAAGLGAAIKTDFAGAGTAFANIVESIQTGSFTWETVWSNIADVVGNVWTMIEPHLTALWTNITAWFAGIDWAVVASTAWELLVSGANILWEFIQPYLVTLLTNIQTWFVTTDWAVVGQAIVDGLGTAIGLGLAALGDSLGTDLLTPIQTASTTIQTAVTTIAETIMSVLGPIITWFQENWTTIQAVVLTAWEVIQSVISAALGVLGPAIQEWVTGVQEGLSTFEPVLQSLGELWKALQPVITVVLQVIGAALLGLVGLVVGAFNGIAQAVQPLISAFTAVLNGVITIVTGIINTIVGFVELAQALFSGNSEEIQAAWEKMKTGLFQIVEGLVSGIVGAITGLVQATWGLLSGFVEGTIEFFQNLYDQLIGHSIITDMITDILAAIIEFGLNFLNIINEMINNVLQAFVNSVSSFVSIGGDIVQGIIRGVQNAAGSLMSSLQNLASNALQAAKDALGISSPSTEFAQIGVDIALGLIEGIESEADNVTETLRSLIDIGSGFSSFASALTKRYEETFVDPLEKAKDGMEKTQKELLDQEKKFAEDVIDLQKTITDDQGQGYFTGITQTVGGLSKAQKDLLKDLKSRRDEALQAGNVGEANRLIGEITELQKIEASARTITIQSAKNLGDLLQLSKGQVAGASPQAVAAAQNLLQLYRMQSQNRREQLLTEQAIAEQQEKIRIEQEKIAAIEKQQADLKFLQQQLDFLDFIEEQGLNAEDILGGLQLGLDADLNALLQAMSGAMQQVIQTAQNTLGIASPSKIFEQIGKQVWQGFDRGTRAQAGTAIGTMRDITRGLVSSVTSGLSNITNNNQRSRSLQLEVNNSFATQPTVTDRSELELLLASFV